MKRSDELKRQHSDLLGECERIQKLAQDQNREFTKAEETRWSALMDKPNGILAFIQSQIAQAEADEQMTAASRASRVSSHTPTAVYDSTGAGPAIPGVSPGYVDTSHIPGNPLYDNGQPRIVLPTLRAFANPRDAYDSGLKLKSMLLAHGPRHDEAVAARDKLISRRGDAFLASQNETAPSDGGYLVTPSFDNAVQVYREQVGAIRRLARIVQVASDTWTGFKQTSGTTVYYPGEEGSITESDADFERYTLTMKKRAILTYVSNELRDDSLVSIMDLLAQDMGHQFALKEDQEGIVGDATSTYGGVQGVQEAVKAATASVATADTGDSTWELLDLDDFYSAMSLLSDKFRGMLLSWLCSGPFKWQAMDRLALAQGGSLTVDVINGVRVPTFLGYPVVVSDRMPTTTAVSQVCALFGAFGQAVILGERSGVRVATSEHFSFDKDRIAVRGTVRYDIHVHEEGDTSTAGAVVGLKTAAS